jgi:hypothetical protein
LAFSVTAVVGCHQDPKDRELAGLPVGIRVTHTPNPVRAQAGGRSGRPYTWLHETRVEFGALVREQPQGNRWELRTIYGRPFNAAEFADWYACPGALLRQGTACVDSSNYTGGDRLLESEARWYFIGRTPSGRRVKGEEIVRMQGH